MGCYRSTIAESQAACSPAAEDITPYDMAEKSSVLDPPYHPGAEGTVAPSKRGPRIRSFNGRERRQSRCLH